jgi:uncharacterized iron-regulated protein
MINLMSLSSRNYTIFESKTGEKISITDLAKKTYQKDVIFFGEFHDDSVVHKIQELYLTELYKLNSSLVVSMEMFERDVQPQIDSFMTNLMDEKQFLKSSRPWPDYNDFYKPLLELAKANKSSLIAANIPRKYAAAFASDGWGAVEKLKPEERKLVTRSMKIEDDVYLKKFYRSMLANMGMDTNMTLTPNQENTLYLYYGAQVIKDETMAESIFDFVKLTGKKVIHFDGDFHSNNYQGTVKKLMERNSKLSLSVLSPYYVENGKCETFPEDSKTFGDYIMVLEENKHEEITQEMMGGHLGENFISKHNIKIDINPEQHFIKGSDLLKFKNPIAKRSSFQILKDLKISKLNSPNGEIEYKIKEDSLYNLIILSPKDKEINEIYYEFSGEVYHSPEITMLNQKHSHTPGYISSAKGEGIYLPGGSYFGQAEKDLADFDIEITLPKDLTLITSGTLVSLKEVNDKRVYQYKSELPTDDMILVGGRYNQKDTTYDGKTFSLFTFSDAVANPQSGMSSADAGNTYLKSSIEYYNLYTKLFGPYPYSNFKIVENFFATGFGMPGYTLLSNKLMLMPWVMLSPGSLAHEFVHNWWGNSVYVDYSSGNWCEALTTFSSNYFYNILTNKPSGALDWRKKALIAISSLPEKANYPLKDFQYQRNNDDAVIGYSKGGFLFYELTKLFGDDKFFSVIKNFATKYKGKRASWFGMRMLFAEQTRKDSTNINTKALFNQWLNDTKIPALELKNVNKDNDSLSFEINQDLKYYMSVPIRFITGKDTIWKSFTITKDVNKFKIPNIANLTKMTLDPDYQCLRKLNKWEIPFSFGQVLSDNPLVITPTEKSADIDVYHNIVKMMKESDYVFDSKSIDELKDNDWKDRSLIILGNTDNNDFYKKFEGKLPSTIKINKEDISINNKSFKKEGNLLLLNYSNPANSSKTVAIIHSGKLDNADQFKRLFHYMSYSMVLISQTQAGRPQSQMEIFPEMTNNSNVEFIFNK